MKKISVKKAGIQRRVSKIFREKKERNGNRCFLSKSDVMLTPAHIVRQSYSIALQDDARNIIPLNQYVHHLFDNGGFKELMMIYPWKCKAIIDRMYNLDPLYANRFLRKNGLENLMR